MLKSTVIKNKKNIYKLKVILILKVILKSYIKKLY